MPWLFILGRGWGLGCHGYGCFSPVVSRFTFTSLTGLVRYIYPKLAEEQCTLVERETFFVDNWSMLDIVWFVDALSYLSWWFQSFFPPVSGRFNGHQAALESIEMATPLRPELQGACGWVETALSKEPCGNSAHTKLPGRIDAKCRPWPPRCQHGWKILVGQMMSEDFLMSPFKRNMIGFRAPACLKPLRRFLFHLMFVKEQTEHKRHQHTLLMKKESKQK
jgi:hypothetical protein